MSWREKIWGSSAQVVDKIKRMSKMSWDGMQSEKTENPGESKPTTHHFPLINLCKDPDGVETVGCLL